MSPIHHKDHPEIAQRPPEHPCATCGHAISESWWLLGYDTCSNCTPANAKTPKKRIVHQEGDAMGTPGKLAGKGSEIYDRRESGVSFAVLALGYDCSEQAVRDAYKMEKGRRAVAGSPVTVLHREPQPKKRTTRVGSKAKTGQGAGDIVPAAEQPLEHPACYGSTDCPLPDGEICDFFDACMEELKDWACGEDEDALDTPPQMPEVAAVEGSSTPEAAAAPANVLVTGWCGDFSSSVFAGDKCLLDTCRERCSPRCVSWGQQPVPAESAAPAPAAVPEPTRPVGWCDEHSCPRIQGAWCIDLKGEICGSGCTSWKLDAPPAPPIAPVVSFAETQFGGRPIKSIDPRLGPEICDQVDKDLVEMPEAPIPFAGRVEKPRSITVNLHAVGLEKLLEELRDPGMAALCRFAEAFAESHVMRPEQLRDALTVAHELGRTPGRVDRGI